MKRLILLLSVAALLTPATALASGVVLKVERSAQLAAVATTPSHVALVHTSANSRLHVGQRVSVTAVRLGNGTYRASSVRILGRTGKVHFRGLLLARSATRWSVSAGGAVISVHRGARVTSSARGGAQPQPGVTVDVTATVGANDELDDDDVATAPISTPGGTIEGHLTLGIGTITIVSEHLNLMFKVPAGLDLSAFRNGDEVVADFTQGADGSLTLARLSTANDDEDTNDDHHHRHGGDGGDDGHHGGGGGDD
jgi:hypothetical protein